MSEGRKSGHFLAAKIIGILDDQKLTVRRAHELTGFAAAAPHVG